MTKIKYKDIIGRIMDELFEISLTHIEIHVFTKARPILFDNSYMYYPVFENILSHV